MNLQSLIQDKIVSKAPGMAAWLAQTLFAAALPEVYQKMPQHLIVMYIGLTPENIKRLKYIVPASVAIITCYGQQLLSHFNSSILLKQHELKCCGQ
jgi:hypothetical protein